MRHTLALVVVAIATGASAVACGTASEAADRPETDATLAPQRPASPPPTVDGMEPPPPAWVELGRDAAWLGYSTFCWASGCADYVAPSCGDARHVPRLRVGRGDLVRVHLGFRAIEVRVSYFPPDGDAAQQAVEAIDADGERATSTVAFRAERAGAFSIFARAGEGQGGADASYAGCLVLD